MKRPIPVIATLVVLVAIGTMIALGFWQLGRMQEKEIELGRYASASAMSAEVPWPTGEADYEGAFYRRSRVECVAVEKVETVAGHSASGETGWAHMARCRLADGGMADVGLGWSRNPKRHYAVPCLYSLEQLRYPTIDGSVSCEKSWEDGPKRLDCESGFGACMTVTATFGLVAVSRVLARLARVEEA